MLLVPAPVLLPHCTAPLHVVWLQPCARPCSPFPGTHTRSSPLGSPPGGQCKALLPMGCSGWGSRPHPRLFPRSYPIPAPIPIPERSPCPTPPRPTSLKSAPIPLPALLPSLLCLHPLTLIPPVSPPPPPLPSRGGRRHRAAAPGSAAPGGGQRSAAAPRGSASGAASPVSAALRADLGSNGAAPGALRVQEGGSDLGNGTRVEPGDGGWGDTRVMERPRRGAGGVPAGCGADGRGAVTAAAGGWHGRAGRERRRVGVRPGRAPERCSPAFPPSSTPAPTSLRARKLTHGHPYSLHLGVPASTPPRIPPSPHPSVTPPQG